VGDGGKVRKGACTEGLLRDVYRGSNKMDAGVQIWDKNVSASFDPCEAVVESVTVKSGRSSRISNKIGARWGRIFPVRGGSSEKQRNVPSRLSLSGRIVWGWCTKCDCMARDGRRLWRAASRSA
jgi:hypothetical protein